MIKPMQNFLQREKNQISHRARALQSLKEKQVKLHG